MRGIVSNKPTITRKELESVLDCLIDDKLARDILKKFESIISETTTIKYSLTTNSLTSAYHLAFKCLEVDGDDEVIIPSYFDIAPLSALSLSGGKAVLVDVEKGSLTPSIKEIRKKITEKTKAIIYGHLLGMPVNVEHILDLKIPLIEDISHAIGAHHDNGNPVGTTGPLTVASFAPSMIITTGNGGVVLTNNPRMYSIMRDLRANNTGMGISYDYCMTEFQGAMGIPQLLQLRRFIKRRREIAKIYHDALRLTSHTSPFLYSDLFVYQSFPIIFDAPLKEVEKYWKKNKIEIYHPIQHPLHEYLNFNAMDYPNSNRLAKKLYSLPIYPTLTKREIEKIANLLAKFI
jgi:perosamine synthetase